ncbi:MAG: hypothetical protein ACREH8_03950, partial [Opitutaceae bacterium]
ASLEPRRLRRHYATHRTSKLITRGLKATAILGWSLRDLCRKAWATPLGENVICRVGNVGQTQA